MSPEPAKAGPTATGAPRATSCAGSCGDLRERDDVLDAGGVDECVEQDVERCVGRNFKQREPWVRADPEELIEQPGKYASCTSRRS